MYSNMKLSLIVIAISKFYTSLTQRIITKTVNNPTKLVYIELESSHSSSLHCQCSQVSISYNSFINLSVTHYHEICSKDFLTTEWLNENIPGRSPLVLYPSTYVDVIPNYIQLIAEFCQSARQTVNTNILQFLSTALIETVPNPSPENFQHLINTRIEHFKSELSLSLLRPLELIREITHINQLATVFRSNWKFLPVNQSTEFTDSGGIRTMMAPVIYNNCDCGLSKQCMEPMVDSYNTTIPGLMIGCYTIEALLQSSLECFYNETCFLTIINRIDYPMDVSLSVLNASLPSRYSLDMKVEEILENLFIEDWSSNISYTEYYKMCAPSSCSLYFQQSAPFVEIIENLLGLYGGLTIIVGSIAVPLLIQFGSYCINRSTRRVQNIDH